MYEYEIRVGFSQCDINTNLNITELIDMFQDCSTFQSQDLGLGFEALEKKHLAWIINYWELEIDRLPRLCERVVVGTAPHDFKGCFGHRNFWMKNTEGQYIVKANSLWTLMDMQKMRPMKAPDYMKEVYVLEEKLDMNYGSRKVAVLEGDDVQIMEREPMTIQIFHLDGNHHVNNGQYIKIAMSAIDEENMVIKTLRTDYRKQAMLGDEVYPVVYKRDKHYVVAINDSEGKSYSVTEITVE